MQVAQAMSRQSRLIVAELSKYSDNAGVQGFLTSAHLYICDLMCIKYSQPAVLNVIKSQIAKVPPKKREYKHFTPSHWYKVVDNMLAGKPGAAREIEGPVYGEMTDYNAFNHITKMYLSEDYTLGEALLINRMVNEETLADIVAACKTAAQNGVRNMAYVKRVLESIAAGRRAEELRIKMLGGKIDQSQQGIRTQIHTHTPIELAQSENEYNKKREDMLLELLVQKLYGGDKK